MNFLNIILILCAAQGFLLALLLFQKHRRVYANRFLAWLMLFFALILLNLFLNELGYYQSYPWMMLVPLGFPFIIGPLHFLYVKHLLSPQKRLQKKDWLHFLPSILILFLFLPDFLTHTDNIIASKELLEQQGYSWKFILFNWIIVAQISIYLWLTIAYLNRHTRMIRDIYSSLEKIRLNWLRRLTFLAITVVASFTLENLLLTVGINLSNYFNLTSFLAALYLYLFGYLGLLKSELFIAGSATSMDNLDSDVETAVVDHTTDRKKYEKSGLTVEVAANYKQQLLAIMENEKPYIDSELTLHQLAEQLRISPHNLSEIINTQLQQNFFDFVNSYRVEQVKADLADPAKQHYKILSLALEAGFNSKSSFNSIFKKMTGVTPSEFRNTINLS